MTRNKCLPECHGCEHRYSKINAMFCPFYYDPSRNEDSDVFRSLQPDGTRLCSVLATKVVVLDEAGLLVAVDRA